MRILLSGIAIAALAIAGAQADPGGQGKGKDGGKDHPAGHVEGKGKGGGDDRGPKADRGGPDKANRGATMREVRGPDRVSPGNSGRDKVRDRVIPGGLANGTDRMDRRDRDGTRVVWRDLDRRGLINGCPPGLAKKNNGCMPPGQFKKHGWDNHDSNWWGLRGVRNLDGYRYLDGNLVRLGANGGVMGYYPLLGGALALGNPWPSGYEMTPLSSYYENYYGLGDDYRYLDGAVYRLDPQTQAIQSIAALLTGDDFAVGQQLPLGYDAYNVPYDFRDDYVDGPDARYRYSDGYVYQVDPKTQLIVAAIDLLT